MWITILLLYLGIGFVFSVMFSYHDYQPETHASYKVFQFVSILLFWLPVMLIGAVKR